MKYRATKTTFSNELGYKVFYTLKRKFLFGVIPYWSINDGPIKDIGQKEEIVMLLNNPDELDRRLNEGIQKLKKNYEIQ